MEHRIVDADSHIIEPPDVWQGAHNPLDVICGAALGVAIGAALNLVFGVPAKQESSPPV